MNLKPTLTPIDAYYTIIVKPMNREEKRRFTFETDKVIRELFPIDAEFLTDLFVRDRDYREAFTERNTQYKEEVAKLNKKNNWKFIKLPDTYFYEEYKPTENAS